eukprot:gnl/MRDRNA2_/MRDRNA2_93221_c0_seq1.p1 gnl/MRDRNA2_/MRDRNA2_93221_c0~~gnl/MRDRNA2_/MRDRNA2_93221_c0_seq1.p1  ORF type:complete len:173 (-),score=25.29 gnl/MRDRNA2_/MRDRNA2_93221_c0_seq1:3-521(-)
MRLLGFPTLLLMALPAHGLRIQRSRCFNPEAYPKAGEAGVSLSQLIYKEVVQQYQSYRAWSQLPRAPCHSGAKFLANCSAAVPAKLLQMTMVPENAMKTASSVSQAKHRSEAEPPSSKPAEGIEVKRSWWSGPAGSWSDLEAHPIQCYDEPSSILPLLIVLPPFLLPTSLLP